MVDVVVGLMYLSYWNSTRMEGIPLRFYGCPYAEGSLLLTYLLWPGSLSTKYGLEIRFSFLVRYQVSSSSIFVTIDVDALDTRRALVRLGRIGFTSFRRLSNHLSTYWLE